jgi:hypothetical protein
MKSMKTCIGLLLTTALLQVSCSMGGKPPEAVKHATFSYEATAAMEPKDIPSLVYVFPPLRSNSSGKPIEQLIPVPAPTGGVAEWKTSSATSMALKKNIEADLRMKGYEMMSFGDLLSVKSSYSVLVISTFYTLPYDVKNDAGEVTDHANLVLIKGALFDGNLDPKTKKDIIKVDGLTKVPVGKEFLDPVSRTVKQAYAWLADNSTGGILLD